MAKPNRMLRQRKAPTPAQIRRQKLKQSEEQTRRHGDAAPAEPASDQGAEGVRPEAASPVI